MPIKRFLTAGLAALAIAACSDRQPLNVSDDAGPNLRQDAGARAALLTDVPVTGVLPGGTFSGRMTITHFAAQGDQILASGLVTGTAVVGGVATEVTQTFTDIPTALTGHHSRCEIVTLDLGPLHLDLLGLVVDLNEVILNVHAESGAGNLLGNLLCSVTNLLNGGGILSSLQGLLDRINALLGAL
jgi:hypothetical protein